MVVRTVGNFLARQGSGEPRRRTLVVVANALVLYVAMLACLVALVVLLFGLIAGKEYLVKPAFMASAVSLLFVYATFQRHFYYREK